MSEETFRVIDSTTDLSDAKYYKVPWDVVLSNGEECDVYKFKDFVHTIGGKWGENSFYACPRGEKPTAENLILFRASSTCRWGFTVNEHSYVKTKWHETYIDDNIVVTILRNDKPFKTIVCNDISYGVACAMKFITEVQEGAVEVNKVNWTENVIGRKIYYKDTPAIITSVNISDFTVVVEPDNDEKCFKKPSCWSDYTDTEWEADYGHGMVVDADSKDIYWFRG